MQARGSSGKLAWIVVIALACLAGLSVWGGVVARHRAARRLGLELAEARKEIEAGLLSSARRRLTRLTEQRPDDAEVAYQLGRCEAARGRPETALAAWARIRADSPWAGPAALESAQAAIAMGRIDRAERMIRAALERPGREVPTLRHLILILLGQQGRIVEARRLVESLWSDTLVIPRNETADRLAMVREHAGLDLETFPLEWNLSRLEGGPTPDDDADRRALALARVHLATRSGDLREPARSSGPASRAGPTTRWSGRRDSTGPSPRAASRKPARPSVTSRLGCTTRFRCSR